MHDDDTVDLLAYLQRLTRYLVPAAVVGLVVALAIASLGFFQKQEFHTKAHVLVQPPETKGADRAPIEAELLSRTMRTYVALEDLPQIVDAAAAKTNGKFTPEQVAERTEIFWGGGSMLLAMKATADNEADAELLSNAMAGALVEVGPGLLKRASGTVPVMSVVEPARTDDDPSLAPTSRTSMVLPGVAAGLIAGLLTAGVLELRSSRRRRVAAQAPATPLERS